MKERFGSIVAACISPNEGLPKYPQQRVIVGEYGLEGDFHNRQMRRSFSKPGTLKPNEDRHITVVAQEALEAFNGELGLDLKAGDFGENFLTKGLGDLADVPEGAVISIGRSIVLRVTKQNAPCKKLQQHHRLMVKAAYGRRGVLCAIVKGRGAPVTAGDDVLIHYDAPSYERYLYLHHMCLSQ